VFLGGTWYKATWREELILKLKIDYFNPVVDDWNETAQQKEYVERQTCDFVLYTITPSIRGVYSIAELVEDSIKRPDQTLMYIKSDDMNAGFKNEMKISLDAVEKMVIRNGARVFHFEKDLVDFLNGYIQK